MLIKKMVPMCFQYFKSAIITTYEGPSIAFLKLLYPSKSFAFSKKRTMKKFKLYKWL